MRIGAACSQACLLALLAAAFVSTPLETRADAPAADAAVDAPSPVWTLTDEALDAWRKKILPTDRETAWENIGWLPSLREGVLEAAAQDKPLLLWVMNGHPLGCT